MGCLWWVVAATTVPWALPVVKGGGGLSERQARTRGGDRGSHCSEAVGERLLEEPKGRGVAAPGFICMEDSAWQLGMLM